MRLIHVELGERGYNIVTGTDCLPELGKHLVELGLRSPIALITDPTVKPLLADTIERILNDAGFKVGILEIAGGEPCKNLQTVSKLYDGMVEMKVERGSGVVALGGGLVGDIAGFAAATFLRGVPFIQVPTSLLAQVDASVGGKVAVDHPKGKNLIGAFWQPRLVFIDTATLNTLPTRELLCGLAEVIKHGIIGEPHILSFVEDRLDELLKPVPATYADLVPRNCRFKAKVVEQDERESGLRAILNFGHTVGHAIEALTAYSGCLHGEAVVWGMLTETLLAIDMGLAKQELYDRLWTLVQRAGYSMDVPHLKGKAMIEAMYHDKKVQDGAIRMVLPESIGQVAVRTIKDTTAVQKAWEKFLKSVK